MDKTKLDSITPLICLDVRVAAYGVHRKAEVLGISLYRQASKMKCKIMMQSPKLCLFQFQFLSRLIEHELNESSRYVDPWFSLVSDFLISESPVPMNPLTTLISAVKAYSIRR